MSNFKSFRLAICAALAMGVSPVLTVAQARADDYYWSVSGCGSGSWNSTCWSPTDGGPATLGPPSGLYPFPSAFLYNSGASNVTVTFDSGDTTSVRGLDLEATATGSMTMSQTSGTVNIQNPSKIGVNTTYNISGGKLTGPDGFDLLVYGTFNQSGGVVSINPLIVEAGGTYNLSGGQISSDSGETITGTFNQTGGTNGPGFDGANISGTYNLSGGAFGGSFVGLQMITGVFNQTGGTFQNSLIEIFGTYNFQGGSLAGSLVGVENGGVLHGTGTMTLKELDVGGTLATGILPGTLTINGDLNTFSNHATLLTKIGATGSDLFHITGSATFSGGTFAFSFLDGFLPTYGSDWVFLTADGGITGWQGLNLDVTGLDSSYSYFITEDPNSLIFNVAAVPEPETYAMLLAGLGLLGFMVRCREQKQQAHI